jgi:V8-like Glu-specific endopeptidase
MADREIHWHGSRTSESAEAPAVPATPAAAPTITGLVEDVPSYARLAEGARTPERTLDASLAISAGRAWDETVLGRDDRVRVDDVAAYPWRAICALRIRSRSGQQYVGTGWFASPHLVVTAGHCVYLHADGGWAEEVLVLPGLAGAAGQAPPARSHRLRTVDGWVAGRAAGSDYGGILLDEPVGERLGWFGTGALDDAALTGSWVNISGYPSDREQARVQYFHARVLVQLNASRLFYDIDTFGGQSGSPIWVTAADGQRVAVGVHTTGGVRENAGTRITGDVLANLRAWSRDGAGGGAAMATAS